MWYYAIFAWLLAIFVSAVYLQTPAYKKLAPYEKTDYPAALVFFVIFAPISLPLAAIGLTLWYAAKRFYSRFLAPRD